MTEKRRLQRTTTTTEKNNDGKEVLLEVMGSGPVNTAVCFSILMLVLSMLYALFVAGSSVQLCETGIVAFTTNPWYGVFVNDPGDDPHFLFSKSILRFLFNVESEQVAASLVPEKKWLVPWCAWCDVASLKGVWGEQGGVGFNQVVNLSSDLSWGNVVYYDVYLPVFQQEDSNGDEVFPVLFTSCLVEFLVTWYLSVSSIGSWELEGDTMQCLLGKKKEKPLVCSPCGNPVRMLVEAKTLPNGTEVLWDNLGKQDIPLDKAYLLYGRCAKLSIQDFASQCGTTRENIRSAIPPIPENSQKSAELLPSGIGTSILSKHLTNFSNVEQDSWAYLVNTIRNGVISGGSMLDVVKTHCSKQTLPNVINLVSSNVSRVPLTSFPESTLIDGDASNWEVSAICWGVYTLFVHMNDDCHPLGVNQMNMSLGDEISLSMSLRAIEAYSPTTQVFTSNYSISSGLFPFSSRATKNWFRALNDSEKEELENQTSPLFMQYMELVTSPGRTACQDRLVKAPGQLGIFVEFMSDMRKCRDSAIQLHVSRVFNGVLFIVAGAMVICFFAILIWGGSSHRTGYTKANIALSLSLVFLSNPNVWFADLHWSTYEYIQRIFFTSKANNVSGSATISIYSEVSTVLFYALFYIHFTFTYIAAGKANRKKFKLSYQKLLSHEWFHVLVATVYFLVRGVLTVLLFRVRLGIVPFVNWISVARICSLPNTSPFPVCAHNDEISPIPWYPFAGILIGTVCDLVLLVLLWRTSVWCKKKIRKQPFAIARHRYLVIFVQTILKRAMLLGLFLSAIIYCSVVKVDFGYDAYLNVNDEVPKMANVSLRVTGVVLWNIGIITIYWVYAIAWLIVMLPVDSFVARTIARNVDEKDLGVAYCHGEQDLVLNEREVVPAVLLDQHTFVLQTHIDAILGTFSCYDVDSTSSFDILPNHITHEEYIWDEETDTHAWIFLGPDRIHICFRGTYSAKNAATDVKLGLARLRWRDIPESELDSITKHAENALSTFCGNYQRKPKAHVGFLKAFHTIQGKIALTVSKCLREDPSLKMIMCSGHSLGGAMAIICGTFLASGSDGRYLVQVDTFGAPRTGNRLFGLYFSSHVASCWRFCKRGDPIPKTPPSIPLRIPFTNIGISTYEHVGVEVLLDLDGDTVIDPSIIDHVVLQRCRSGGKLDHIRGAYLVSMISFAINVLQIRSHDDKESFDDSISNYKVKLWTNAASWLEERAVWFNKCDPAAVAKVQSFVRKQASPKSTSCTGHLNPTYSCTQELRDHEECAGSFANECPTDISMGSSLDTPVCPRQVQMSVLSLD